MLGKDPQKAIDAIAKQMNNSKFNAGRLVMTEEAYFSSAAQKDCFNELGVEEYEIVATLDSKTSEICQSMDGQHFPMKAYQAGVTAPPFHVWCRSTTAPYFDEQFDIGERAARDENGNTYYIPDDVDYKEWKETFVDGGDKSGFKVVDDNSTVHYKYTITENELKLKIADADVQLDDLKSQADSALAAFGVDYDEVMSTGGGLEAFHEKAMEAEAKKYVAVSDEMHALEDKYGGWDELLDNGTDEDLLQYDKLVDEKHKIETEMGQKAAGFDTLQQQFKDLQQQISDLETQKTEWQEKLNEKLIVKEKKALTKQQMSLETQKAYLQQQLDDFDVKTYSGIWKSDVTTADFSNLNIEGKKKYYEGKFLTETDTDLLQKYHDLYDQLEELETEGKSYADIQSELNRIETEIKDVQSDLTKLENGGIANNPFSADAYGKRKADAIKNRFTNDVDADAYYRAQLDRDFLNTPDAEKYSVWEYSHNSNPINKPLSGYTDTFSRSDFKGFGNVSWSRENSWRNIPANFAKFGQNGNVTYENVIKDLTKTIEKTTFDKDVLTVRGSGNGALAGLAETAGLDFNTVLDKLNKQDITWLKTNLEGKTFKNNAFTSTAMVNVPSAFRNNVYYEIYMPKGTKALYAEPQSFYGGTIRGAELYNGQKAKYVGNEAEIILQRGTEFRVTEIEIKSDIHSGYSNVYTVKMEVAEQPDYFKSGYEHTFNNGLTSEK